MQEICCFCYEVRCIHTYKFQHVTGKLAKHDSSYTHKQAMLSWAEYVKNADRNTLIGDQLDSTRKQQIQEN